MSHGVGPAVAITHGYVLAFRVGAVLLLIGGALIGILLEHVSGVPHTPGMEVESEPAPEPEAKAARTMA